MGVRGGGKSGVDWCSFVLFPPATADPKSGNNRDGKYRCSGLDYRSFYPPSNRFRVLRIFI